MTEIELVGIVVLHRTAVDRGDHAREVSEVVQVDHHTTLIRVARDQFPQRDFRHSDGPQFDAIEIRPIYEEVDS